LTDIFTILEKTGDLKNLKMAFVGDGDNNVTNSLLLLAARLGIDFTVACPQKYRPRPEILALAASDIKKTGAKIEITDDAVEAVKDARIIHTDVWVSMGREDKEERLKNFKPYQLNSELLKKAPKGALVMHCLPAHRGEEITDEVMDGPQSIVFDQAENRLHVQKAILTFLLGAVSSC
jgi:ornithine carbamoyltransferase